MSELLQNNYNVKETLVMSTKAQQALVDAFNELVLERRYEEIHVADVIKRADVSRSTFYEHFRNKEEILCNNLEAVMFPIANASAGSESAESLSLILDHFAEVTPLALAYFHSPLSQVMSGILGKLTEEVMDSSFAKRIYRIPRNLVSLQLAEANLGLIKAWLESDPRIEAIRIASQIIDGSKALLGSCSESHH